MYARKELYPANAAALSFCITVRKKWQTKVCINIQKRTYKYAVELSFSKSATFSLQKLPF